MALSTEQRRANRRLGLILASVALALVLGFVARVVWL
ncbi:MAG: cytochrome oxidase small assembly protein [Proteobacteria bacterium]|nr:cytochrome oxidase small assembly protein [Pseudomonadota bacterium]MDA0868020.1 cytochrome oxidase small assembly protein [Pseudomonadota bacterium]MDA1328979.1 cytochrome oxidase small assembly protein [Pseudomonadota bacterium]